MSVFDSRRLFSFGGISSPKILFFVDAAEVDGLL